MSLRNYFAKIFGKKEVKTTAERSLISEMVRTMDLFSQKAQTLNDSWAQEKETVDKLCNTVKTFTESQEIIAAKFEQDILGKITAASSACDAAIAGKPDNDFKAQLHSLETSINQRASM